MDNVKTLKQTTTYISMSLYYIVLTVGTGAPRYIGWSLYIIKPLNSSRILISTSAGMYKYIELFNFEHVKQ